MTRYTYSAIDKVGEASEGVIKATSLGEARQALLDAELFPVKLEEKRGALQFELTKEKVKKKELMQFTRQLAVFVKAGIPLTDALVIIGDETTDVALQRTITGMVEDLRNGGTLSGAAAKYPESFPKYFIGILGSAELTGRLDETLENLAGYLERELDTQSKVISALSYPGVVMSLALVTVAILAPWRPSVSAAACTDAPIPASSGTSQSTITVTARAGARPEVRFFDLDRSLTGMAIERYASADDVHGGRPPDVLARRLFGLGATHVTVYSNVVTVRAGDWSALEATAVDLCEHLMEYYGEEAGWSPAALGVDAVDANPHVLGEGRHDLIAFVQTQQARIDENADEAIADCLVQQGRNDG